MNMLQRSSHPVQDVASTLALTEDCQREVSELIISAIGDAQVWNEFIAILEREKLLVTVNWNEKADDIADMLAVLANKFGIQWQYKPPRGLSGKLPEESMKSVGDSLEKVGLVLLHIWTSEDCYRVFVLPAPAFLRIQAIAEPIKRYGGIWRWNSKMPYSV